MILDDKAFEQITAEDILSLVPDVAEGKRIDYKEAPPTDGEKGVRSFLNDVCAFANGAGGFLIYGIAEERDEDGTKTGVPQKIVGVGDVAEDQMIQAWQQRINQTIEPRVIGHRVGFVNGFDDGAKVMVVYVPRSLLAPHRVTYAGKRDFYIRHDRSNELMDMGEIRAAFVDLNSLSERLDEYRVVRISKVLAEETPTVLAGGWSAVLHLIPFGSLGGETAIDLNAVEASSLPTIGSHTSGRRLNLDGWLYVSPYDDTQSSAYVQVFRNGIIELAQSEPSMAGNGVEANGNPTPPLIASQWFEEGSLGFVAEGLRLLATLGVKPPIYVGLSLLRTKGFGMARNNRMAHFRFNTPTIDRDTVMAPFVVCESMTEDVGRLMKPALDVVWQAAGLPQSDYYDADGNWKRD